MAAKDFAKSENGIKANKINGVTDEFVKLDNKDQDCGKNGIIDDIPYEVNKACGDFVKDGQVFLTRRTAKAAYGPDFDFESIIKK